MTDHFIIFTVADTSYAIPSDQIAHVEMVEEVTRVPNAPHFVDGVVFSRGAVVPAISLRARFGFAREAHTTRTRLLGVQFGGRTVGLIVDAAREFVTIPESVIKPPNDALTGMSGRYLRGIATMNDRMILLLDLDSVLNPEDPAMADTSALATRYSQEMR